MVALARIFTELARDEQGTYFSLQGSGTSTIVQLDNSSASLISLAAPPGDNQHVHLSLGDEVIYFAYRETLYSIPRTGGDITQLLTGVPTNNQFVVVGQRAFFDLALEPELHELPLDGGEPVVHARDVTSLLRDGSDLYFAQGGELYRASGADVSAAQSVAVGSIKALLGSSGDWIYGTGGADTDWGVWRFPKSGGDRQKILSLPYGTPVALADNALVFVQRDESFTYVCSVDLDGKTPTMATFRRPAVPVS